MVWRLFSAVSGVNNMRSARFSRYAKHAINMTRRVEHYCLLFADRADDREGAWVILERVEHAGVV